MDLVTSAINFKQAATMSKVQYAVAGKIMDQARSNGNAMIKLLNAANIGPARAGDQLVAAATGLGGSLDTQG